MNFLNRLLCCFFVLCFFAPYLQSQNIVCNQYNAQHKKQGYWKVYFTDRLYWVNDSTEASYFGYDYYVNGTLVNQCINTVLRSKNMLRIEHEGVQGTPGKPIALDGLFKTYDNGGLAEALQYSHGICQTVKSYFSNSGIVFELVDYTQHYQDKPYSFRHQLRRSDDSIKTDEWVYYNEKGALKTVKNQ